MHYNDVVRILVAGKDYLQLHYIMCHNFLYTRSIYIKGASLSKPHRHVKCELSLSVCLYLCLTVNIFSCKQLNICVIGKFI